MFKVTTKKDTRTALVNVIRVSLLLVLFLFLKSATQSLF